MEVEPSEETEFDGQLLHISPAVWLYLPSVQILHGPPYGPLYPGRHLQKVDPAPEVEFVGHARHVLATVAPTVEEYVFSAQAVHGAEPAISLYFPAAHAKHVVPVKPGWHSHAVAAVLPAGDVFGLIQAVHAASDAAPVPV